MFKRIFAFSAALIIFLSVGSAYVQGQDCSAASAIVLDAASGEILYEKNIFAERSMASTTKIMTALIACESGGLDSIVNITDDMVNTVGTSLGLRSGDSISLYDLVVGMLLASGNDAANSTAVYLAGSVENFAKMMNEKAVSLGMEHTHFVTPSGLDEGNHHSCAYDMAVLTAAALENEIFASVCRAQSMEITISGKKQTLYNHNKLLYQIDGCIGVKTGFTSKAGRCLVSAVRKNGYTMICVTLNDGDDWNDHKKLLAQCEKSYGRKSVEGKVNINIVGAGKDTLTAEYKKEISVVDPQYLTVEVYHFPFIYAPISVGDEVGEAVIKYKDREIARVAVVAGESVNYYAKQK